MGKSYGGMHHLEGVIHIDRLALSKRCAPPCGHTRFN